jgi:multiple sugar transport system ATP-binding protein
MCEYLRARQLEHRAATVYVTHDQDEALRLADRIVVMDAGEILQVGAPGQVHDDPATLFVARFVGSPGMNLLGGELRNERGETRFAARGSAASFPIGVRAPDGPAVLGVRPERLRGDPRGELRGRVVLDAFAGACRHRHVETPFGRVVVRTGPEERAADGEEVGLALEPGAARLFDPSSGRRLA